MGDRSNCTLTYPAGLLKKQEYEIAALCQQTRGYENGERSFSYDDMNYAEMPEELVEWFEANGIAYAWTNEQGYEYGPSVVLYLPSEAAQNFPLIDYEISLTTSDLDKPEIVARARRAAQTWASIRSDAVTPSLISHPSKTVTLKDWRSEEGSEPDASISLIFSLTERAAEFKAPDGRSILIEVEGGDLRVHGYSAEQAEPTSLRISASGVLVT